MTTTINKVTTTTAFQGVSLLDKAAVKLVTLDQLAEVLKNTTLVNKMGTFATVLQLTEPKCNKKCRQTGIAFSDKVLKLSKVNIVLNSEYEANVTNQLSKENKGKEGYKKGRNTMPLIKGENNNFFGTYNENPVIEYRPNPNPNLTTSVTYFKNDFIEVNKTDLPDVLPSSYRPTNQGTEKVISWRKLYVRNIVSIKLNGVTYQRI